MTIAVTVKVHDGVVVASDSATTLSSKDAEGNSSIKIVYNHQNKIFNLVKDLSVGAITFGQGSIGHASISTLSKDLRVQLTKKNGPYSVDRDDYTMEQISTKARQFFEDKFEAAYKDDRPEGFFGYWIVGYSYASELSEIWDISFENGHCDEPTMKRDEDECGIEWSGEPEAITRLILGRSQQLPEILLRMGLEQEKLPEAMREIDSVLMTEVLHNPMPIQDAIDLANFLVDLTIRFTKFKPGGNTVGGPIEIAAITKHEGFKWVKRKHYFDKVLNSGADDARAT